MNADDPLPYRTTDLFYHLDDKLLEGGLRNSVSCVLSDVTGCNAEDVFVVITQSFDLHVEGRLQYCLQ